MIGIFDAVQSLNHELVLQGLRVTVVGLFSTHQDAEIEESADFHVIILRPGFLIDCGKPIAEYFNIVRVYTVQP